MGERGGGRGGMLPHDEVTALGGRHTFTKSHFLSRDQCSAMRLLAFDIVPLELPQCCRRGATMAVPSDVVFMRIGRVADVVVRVCPLGVNSTSCGGGATL